MFKNAFNYKSKNGHSISDYEMKNWIQNKQIWLSLISDKFKLNIIKSLNNYKKLKNIFNNNEFISKRSLLPSYYLFFSNTFQNLNNKNIFINSNIAADRGEIYSDYDLLNNNSLYSMPINLKSNIEITSSDIDAYLRPLTNDIKYKINPEPSALKKSLFGNIQSGFSIGLARYLMFKNLNSISGDSIQNINTNLDISNNSLFSNFKSSNFLNSGFGESLIDNDRKKL